MVNFRVKRLGSIRCVDFNNIKPGLQIRGVFGQIQCGGGADSVLLSPVNVLHRLSKIRRFPKFYLHKYQKGFVFDNEVDFPEPDSPVITTSLLRGISTSMFFRLLTRLPRRYTAFSAGIPPPTLHPKRLSAYFSP
jgi:hypothetical protein